MKIYQSCFITFFLLFGHSLVSAHDSKPLYDEVYLQAQAIRDIPNEELTVLLTAEAEGESAAKVADKINRDIGWALDMVRKQGNIKSRTLSYNTYPTYAEQTIVGWGGRQELQLKSRHISELTELLGKLQQRLRVVSMHFNPTRETYERHKNELIEEALIAFKQKVEIVKKHMDKQSVRIVKIFISANGRYESGLRHAYAGSDSAMLRSAAPAVEAGTNSLSVTVSGSVQFF